VHAAEQAACDAVKKEASGIQRSLRGAGADMYPLALGEWDSKLADRRASGPYFVYEAGSAEVRLPSIPVKHLES
jgi:hypothetical protein